MAKIKSLKEFLDWVAHGKLLVELAFAFAGLKAIKAILVTFTKIPVVWMSTIEWLSVSLAILAAWEAAQQRHIGAAAPGEPNVESSCGASSNVRLGGLF